MLTLKKQYVDNGWTSFPEHEGMKFADLYCPGCGGALSSDGRVRIDDIQDAPVPDSERTTFPGTEYAMAELKEEKRKPGRPKRV
jgi:hypothetical protein